MSDVELLDAHVRKLEDVILRFRQATSHDGIISEYHQACVANALPGGRMDSDVGAKYNREMGQILALLLASRTEGMTRAEIAKASGIRESTVCARVSQLMREGKAVELGGTRKSEFGAEQKVVHAGEPSFPTGPGPFNFCCPSCREIAFRSTLYLIAGQFYLTARWCSECGYREVS